MLDCGNYTEWLCCGCDDERKRNCACYFSNEEDKQPQPLTENELQLTLFNIEKDE